MGRGGLFSKVSFNLIEALSAHGHTFFHITPYDLEERNG